MTQTSPTSDPYAPPPRKRDHSGAVLRTAVIVALLTGAGFMAATFFSRPPAPVVAEATDAERFALGAAQPAPAEATPEMPEGAAPAESY